jgi:TolB-like protein/Tfp pilus assembly protein PilF
MSAASDGGPGGFFEELKRRRVVRAVAWYAAIAFLVMQAAELVVPGLGLPEWTFRAVVVVAVLGIPVAAVLSWVFDWTPEGVRKTGAVGEAAGGAVASSGARPVSSGPSELAPGSGDGLPGDSGSGAVAPARPTTTASRLAFGALMIAVIVVGGWRLFGPGDALADVAAIAVLPLDNLSADPDDEFLALGLTHEILTQLHTVSAMRVTSNQSMMQYRDTEKSVRMIAEELGVRYVVEGSAQAQGDRVRINLQLIDATTDSHLWAETFERSKDDLFAAQAEIAQRVARSVQVELQPDERQRLGARPTHDAEAYAWFLRARAHALEGWQGQSARFDRGEVWALATEAYVRAIEIDPQYALAHAELAMHLERTMWMGHGRTDANRQLALRSLERAIELAPESPRTLLAAAHKTYYYDNHWTNAVAELEALESVMPADPDHLWMLGFSYRRVARFVDAVETLERSLALDPLNWQLYFEIRQTNLRMRRYDAAMDVSRRAVRAGVADSLAEQLALAVARADVAEERRVLEQMLARDGEGSHLAYQWWLGIHSADFEAALDALDRAPAGGALADDFRVITLLMIGDTIRARALAETSLSTLQARFDENPAWPNRRPLAHAYFAVGRVDEGRALLREFLDRPWPQPDIDQWAGPNRFLFEVARSIGLAWAYDASVFDEVFDMWETLLEMDEYPFLGGNHLRLNRGWDVIRDHPRFQEIQARADSIDRALGWNPKPTSTGVP